MDNDLYDFRKMTLGLEAFCACCIDRERISHYVLDTTYHRQILSPFPAILPIPNQKQKYPCPRNNYLTYLGKIENLLLELCRLYGY